MNDVTDSDDVFPTKSEVQLVLVCIEDLMKDSLPSLSSSPRMCCHYLRCSGAKGMDLQEDEGDRGRWQYFRRPSYSRQPQKEAQKSVEDVFGRSDSS